MHMHHTHIWIFNKPDTIMGASNMIHMMCVCVAHTAMMYIYNTHNAHASRTQPNIQQARLDEGCLQHDSYDVSVWHVQPCCICVTHMIYTHDTHSRIFNELNMIKGVFNNPIFVGIWYDFSKVSLLLDLQRLNDYNADFWEYKPGCLVLASNLPVCNLVVKFSTLWVCLSLPLNNEYV